jgi:quercetin dioxygenase-like cupin family protein
VIGPKVENRRTFLGLAVASLASAGLDSQVPEPQARIPARPTGILARHALTGSFEGYEAVVGVADMRHFPGASTPVHQHAGILLAFVLEGRVRFAINNEPEQIVPTGGTFFEPLGAVHTTSGSASPDEPTRIVIFEVVPKGSR